MAGYIQAPDQTYSNIASALSSIPINISSGRMSEQDRQLKAHQLQMKLNADEAQAEKYRAETAQITQSNEMRTNLARNLETLNRDMSGNPMYSGPPGNMVSRPMTQTDTAGAQAGLMLSFDNPQQGVGAYRDMRDAYTSRDAVNAIMDGNTSMGSKLNAVANQQAMPDQFKLNANGARLDVYGGGVDTNNPMAQSEIALNVAQANNARTAPGGKQVMIDQLPQEMQAFFQTQILDELGTPTAVTDQEKVRSWLEFQAFYPLEAFNNNQYQQFYTWVNAHGSGSPQAGAGQADPLGIRSPAPQGAASPPAQQSAAPAPAPPVASPITPNTAPVENIPKQRTNRDVSEEAARQLGIKVPANLSNAPVQAASLSSLAEKLGIFIDNNQVIGQPGGSIVDARKRKYDALKGVLEGTTAAHTRGR